MGNKEFLIENHEHNQDYDQEINEDEYFLITT